MKNIKTFEKFSKKFPFFKKEENGKRYDGEIMSDEKLKMIRDIDMNDHIYDGNEDDMDIYDGYETDNPFYTLDTFLNNELQVDLDYEMGEDQSASSYLDDEIDKILKKEISNDKKIKKMMKIITKFEISMPPYKWTGSKKEILKDKLEDMLDFYQ